MRIDKLLSETGTATRREAAIAARAGKVTLNGQVVRRVDMHINPEVDLLRFAGETVVYKRFIYIMLNKPAGVISATDDARERTVLDLLPEKYGKMGLFPCGRLDRDTVGLLILTNNGDAAHNALSPKHHVDKTYRFTLDSALADGAEEKIAAGVTLVDGYECLPASLTLDETRTGGEITVSEGKFHQIKRMFESFGRKVTFLERICFAGIELDGALGRGEWRELTASEAAKLESL